MPELPEVESLRLSLLPYLESQKIVSTKVLLPKIVSGKGTKRKSDEKKVRDFEKNTSNKIIKKISRRAKNIIIKFEDNSLILIHLKMTGQLVFQKENQKTSRNSIVFGGHPIQLSEQKLPNKHSYIIFEMDNGTLFYNDVRQFGYVLYYQNEVELEKEKHFEGLGWEPLDENFTEKVFITEMKKRKGILKKLFLDQKVVVGLGNIYADEVAFEGGVRPYRKVESLTKNELKKIYQAIKKIIPKAIELGGSSVSDYLLADGSRGNYAREHKVYKRAGKACLTCGTELIKIDLAGRTTVYCPKCQK